jgi:hypothetical protein
MIFRMIVFIFFYLALSPSMILAQVAPDITEPQILQMLFGNHSKSEIPDNTLLVEGDNTRRGVYAIWNDPPPAVINALERNNKPTEFIVKVSKLSFFPASQKDLLVQLYTNVPKHDCHWCLPAISFATFSKADNEWQLKNFYEYIGSFGAYGLPNEFDDLFFIGKDKIGIPMSQWVTGQGYYQKVTGIFSEIDNKFQRVLTIEMLENNSGACINIESRFNDHEDYLGAFSQEWLLVDAVKKLNISSVCSSICWGYTTHFGIIESNQDWFDIVTVKSGTKLNSDNCVMDTFSGEVTRFVFSETEQQYLNHELSLKSN